MESDTPAGHGELILIVEDEAKLASVLTDYLVASGYRTHWESSGDAVLAAVREHRPDLVLLDLMLPGKDGIEVCRDIRGFSSVPVVMITARVEEIDRVIGLNVGADDYVCKPFGLREVVARIKAILRRAQISDMSLEPHALKLNDSSYKAVYANQPVDLTPVEFRLLSTLLRSPGRVFSRAELLDRLHGYDRLVTDRTIDSHVKNLRRKLEQIRPDREIIRSVYGVGYKLEF